MEENIAVASGYILSVSNVLMDVRATFTARDEHARSLLTRNPEPEAAIPLVKVLVNWELAKGEDGPK